MTTMTTAPAPLAPGDAVLVDGTRALRVCIPGPPFARGGNREFWLAAVVETARTDGWVVARLHPRRGLQPWSRRVVVPPEAVHPCGARAA